MSPYGGVELNTFTSNIVDIWLYHSSNCGTNYLDLFEFFKITSSTPNEFLRKKMRVPEKNSINFLKKKWYKKIYEEKKYVGQKKSRFFFCEKNNREKFLRQNFLRGIIFEKYMIFPQKSKWVQ